MAVSVSDPSSPIPAKSHLSYRPDIDGLRAVAVLAVVLFHASPQSLRGGFIGVDIFFVISGFLITTIILADIAKGRFSLADFYGRRVRRIFPALSLVLLATLAFGWFALLVDEFQQLGRDVSAGIAFVSNIVFWMNSGYFDSAAELKPTLHLWSLGVEEQFYLFWPLAVTFVIRRKWHPLLIACTFGVASFALGVYQAHAAPMAAFYSPLTRFWELAVGGLLAYVFLHKPEWLRAHTNLRSALGLLLLCAGLGAITPESRFPGFWALLPVLGAALLISAGPHAWINSKLLSNRPAVWIGLISYPLYLWHWPILSFMHILSDAGNSGRVARASAVLASIALAWLTYRLIETPVRLTRLRTRTTRRLAALMLALLGTSLCVAASLLPARNDDASVQPVLAASADWKYFEGMTKVDKPQVHYELGGARGKDVTVFLGDSHVEQYAPRLTSLFQGADKASLNAVSLITAGGCPPIPEVLDDSPGHVGCSATRQYGLDFIASDAVKTVVIGACWSCYFLQQTAYPKAREDGLKYYTLRQGTKHYFQQQDGAALAFEQLDALLAKLRAYPNKRIFLLLDNPIGAEYDPKTYVEGTRWQRMSVKQAPHALPMQRNQVELRNRLIQLAQAHHVELLDPLAMLCHDEHCAAFDADNLPVYRDESHVRAAFVRAQAKFLDVAVQRR